MKKLTAFLVLLFTALAFAQAQIVTTVRDAHGGWELRVDGHRFFVKGVNWSVNPPGTHGVWSLWNESDATVRRVIDAEAQMMVAAGVNAIRVGPDIPARWVEHLYFMWGIHTIVHDVFGRWGTSAEGRFYRPTNFFLPHIREQLLRNSLEIVERFSGVNGVLMYMFGDGNGDGLYWSGDDDHLDIIARFGTNPGLRRGNALFSLLEEVFSEAKRIDPRRLFAFVNNDLGWLPIIADVVPSMDVLAVNMNRGMRAGPDFWQGAASGIDRPVVIASIGVDAWNARLHREDQFHQAVYTLAQWEDIYANAFGHGMSNSLGGVVNAWTDMWYHNDHYSWEFAGIQDTEALFEHSGFAFDHVPGQPNVNPEWMGITAQGPRIVAANIRERLPRAAYYVLQQIWSVNPWELSPMPPQVITTTTVNEDGETVAVTQTVPGTGLSPAFRAHFADVDITRNLVRGLQDSWQPPQRWTVRNQFTFTGMQTGHDVSGHLRDGGSIFDAFRDVPFRPTRPPLPDEPGYDSGAPGGGEPVVLPPHPSIPVGVQYAAELRTTFWGVSDAMIGGGSLEGEVTVYFRFDRDPASPGLPPRDHPEFDPDTSPWYRPGGQLLPYLWPTAPMPLQSLIHRTSAMGLALRPIDLYQAWFRWTGFGAEVHGFFHSGRGDWMGRGDFFNFALESWDQYSGDLWNIRQPMGVEFRHSFGMGANQGLSVLAGPRIFPGANPMLVAMWNQDIPWEGHLFRYSVAFSQELGTHDIQLLDADSDLEWPITWGQDPIPQPLAAGRASLWFSWQPQMTDTSSFTAQMGLMASNWQKIGDAWETVGDGRGEIGVFDTLALKTRLNFSPIQHFGFMAEFIYAGLVADTNWHPYQIGSLHVDAGLGNRVEVKAGVTGSHGNFALGLNALWRQPIVGPSGGTHFQTNPFRISGNRETLALEFIFAFDMEPGSWIWWWNNPDTEGAFFATTLVARYNIFEGATDPGLINTGDPNGSLAWMPNGFPETRGNYSIAWRKFFNPNSDFRFVNTLSFTRGHPNNGLFGDCIEAGRSTISGWSNSLQMRYKRLVAGGTVTKNLWGTGYTMDWNMTFPWRWSMEMAFSFDPRPSLVTSGNRVGVRWNGVTRDEFSPHLSILGGPVDTHELVLFFDFSF